jgi:hypothetical protein
VFSESKIRLDPTFRRDAMTSPGRDSYSGGQSEGRDQDVTPSVMSAAGDIEKALFQNLGSLWTSRRAVTRIPTGNQNAEIERSHPP